MHSSMTHSQGTDEEIGRGDINQCIPALCSHSLQLAKLGYPNMIHRVLFSRGFIGFCVLLFLKLFSNFSYIFTIRHVTGTSQEHEIVITMIC